jgi:hypothetical protein
MVQARRGRRRGRSVFHELICSIILAEQFFEPPTENLRQGDIFAEVPFSFLVDCSTSPVAKLTAERHSAILLNQSCDVDKGYQKLVLLPVLPLRLRTSEHQKLIKTNRIFYALYLSSYRDVLPDSYVSFLEPMTVERATLEAVPRIASLTEVGRRAFYVQYARWLTRWQLAEISCPSCGAAFNPAATLPVENS